MTTYQSRCGVPFAVLLFGIGGPAFAQSGDEEVRATAIWRPQAPEKPEGPPQVDLEPPQFEVERPRFERPDFGLTNADDEALQESRVESPPAPVMVEVPDSALADRAAPVPLPDAVAQPSYPREALQNGVEGFVELLFTVSADGEVTEVTITEARPAGIFNQAVLDAILKWRFKPALENGEPVDQRVRHRFDFSLEN